MHDMLSTHNRSLASSKAPAQLALVVALAMVCLNAVCPNDSLAQSEGDGAAVPAEILVILAKEEEGSIDKELRSIAALQRAPFNTFRSMNVLSKPRVSLAPEKPEVVRLPNGRLLQLTLDRTLPDGRHRVRAAINRPNENDYLPLLRVVASPGDPFFVAGQSYRGGTLVVGVRMEPDAEPEGKSRAPSAPDAPGTPGTPGSANSPKNKDEQKK